MTDGYLDNLPARVPLLGIARSLRVIKVLLIVSPAAFVSLLMLDIVFAQAGTSEPSLLSFVLIMTVAVSNLAIFFAVFSAVSRFQWPLPVRIVVILAAIVPIANWAIAFVVGRHCASLLRRHSIRWGLMGPTRSDVFGRKEGA